MDAVVDLVTSLSATSWALAVLFALAVLDGFFPPVPSEIALTTLVVTTTPDDQGPARAALTVLVAVAGAVCGDLVAHLLGRSVGTARLARRVPRLRAPLTRAARAFADHGPTLLVSGRFVPGWRVALTTASGVVGMPLGAFLAVDLVSATLWGTLHGGLALASGTVLAHHPLAATAVGVVVGTLVGTLLGRFLATRGHRRLPSTPPADAPAPRQGARAPRAPRYALAAEDVVTVPVGPGLLAGQG